jgi:hypothetical protein
LPCKFENNLHGTKDMLAYYMLYNFTLAPSNLFTSWDKPLEIDTKLLSLKTALDNSVLELKAIEKGLDFIPKINTSF